MGDIQGRARLLGVLLLVFSPVTSRTLDGELAALGRITDDGNASYPVTFGLRYIPTLFKEFPMTEERFLDLEMAVNLSASHRTVSLNREGDVSAYRLWIRYSTPRFESRLGLQKLNFGPAKLLRSLMWFDRLDPQDPLQLAEGVYGLRLGYVFRNNASLWLWGLYGNNDAKGLEVTPTAKRSPEYGGRFQFPTGPGEMAVTAHGRMTEIAGDRVSEKRIALDGVWDIGPGVLFESALVRTDSEDATTKWQSFLTLGMDYTFGFGNGITVLGEHLVFTVDDRPFGTATKRNMSGVMASYPMGLMDRFSYFAFCAWDDDLPYHYMSWQRNYDSWIFHLSVFWSGETASQGENRSIEGFGKKGLQLMIIFNH